MFSLEVGIKPLCESVRDEIKTHPYLLASIAMEEADKTQTPEAYELRKMAFYALVEYLMNLESELLQLRMALGRKRNKVSERQRLYRLRMRDDPSHATAKWHEKLDEIADRQMREIETDPAAWMARSKEALAELDAVEHANADANAGAKRSAKRKQG